MRLSGILKHQQDGPSTQLQRCVLICARLWMNIVPVLSSKPFVTPPLITPSVLSIPVLIASCCPSPIVTVNRLTMGCALLAIGHAIAAPDVRSMPLWAMPAFK